MLKYARVLYVLLIQALPVRYRFAVITLSSYLFAPWLRHASFLKKHRAAHFKFDTDVSPALIWCIRPVMHLDLGLEVVINDQVVTDSVKSGKGTVLIGYHGNFMPASIAHMRDHNFDVNSWSIREREVYFGREIKHAIQPSPTAFFKAKNLLMDSKMIAVLIDFETKCVKRSQEIDTQFGKMYITDSFFKLATTCNANVIFMKYRVKGKKIVFEFSKASGIGLTPESMTQQYISFLQKRVPVADTTEFVLNGTLAHAQLA